MSSERETAAVVAAGLVLNLVGCLACLLPRPARHWLDVHTATFTLGGLLSVAVLVVLVYLVYRLLCYLADI